MSVSQKTLTTLEFDKIIKRLTAQTQTAVGRGLAAALAPSSDYRDVVRRQRLTAEARRLREMKPGFGLGGVRDIAGLVRQASLGHALEPGELLDVQATLIAARAAKETIARLRAFIPFLAEIADAISDFRDLAAEIGRAVNQRGEVVDDASPVLAQLRRESRLAHDRLTARLNQIVYNNRGTVQEPIVTVRDGRYVIPVKAELRSQLPGIVHGVSASGATVFLEPLETVEMGNRWRELIAEEEREVARILRALSEKVGLRASEIGAALEAVGQIDLALAKARLGEEMKAQELPHDGPEQAWLREDAGSLLLRNARHPLLGDGVVPITVWLGRCGPDAGGQEGPFTTLLITGPNTGGKTVALKTVGLLALMAQAGLPVPADGDSQIPVFDAVFADIGDEQSIEQSLSTFSSHISNIIGILASATRRSLVLLDELAAGTDPAEGAALAKAILSHLLRTGCLCLATTHHGELKAFAHVTPGIANASVEFDPDTLAPTYRLHIGLPGQSNALAIAQRLGMPAEILQEARAALGPDRLAVESLISHLHREREAAETASAAQRAAAREAERARQRVTQELQSLEANRERLIRRTQEEMEAELQRARLRLRQAVQELERAERMTVFERAAAVQALKEEIAAVEEATKQISRKRQRRRRGRLPPIAPGDRVYLLDIPAPGEALTAPDGSGELEVKLGSLRARINVRQIERVEPAPPEQEPVRGQQPDGSTLASAFTPELDLRGLTVDEALLLVDQRLDDAARAGVRELRVIHGKGTGALRRAVREMLSRHALVRSHAPAQPRAGGDGVTVVEIAV
jgi:DNA mismatch repair protein MutS2